MSKYPSLDFAQAVTDRANAAWEDGSFMESVTPTTKALLTYWFEPAFSDLRNLNFHQGQRQAILNAIYIHEVLKKERVLDVYEAIAPQILLQPGSALDSLGDEIYNHPKYAIKMATGERVIIVTGCINALRSRVSGTLVNMIHALLRVIRYNYCKQCMRSKDVLALQY